MDLIPPYHFCKGMENYKDVYGFYSIEQGDCDFYSIDDMRFEDPSDFDLNHMYIRTYDGNTPDTMQVRYCNQCGYAFPR